MKVRSSLKCICANCKIVKRRGVLRVVCKAEPNHKQCMAGKAKKMK